MVRVKSITLCDLSIDAVLRLGSGLGTLDQGTPTLNPNPEGFSAMTLPETKLYPQQDHTSDAVGVSSLVSAPEMPRSPPLPHGAGRKPNSGPNPNPNQNPNPNHNDKVCYTPKHAPKCNRTPSLTVLHAAS